MWHELRNKRRRPGAQSVSDQEVLSKWLNSPLHRSNLRSRQTLSPDRLCRSGRKSDKSWGAQTNRDIRDWPAEPWDPSWVWAHCTLRAAAGRALTLSTRHMTASRARRGFFFPPVILFLFPNMKNHTPVTSEHFVSNNNNHVYTSLHFS